MHLRSSIFGGKRIGFGNILIKVCIEKGRIKTVKDETEAEKIVDWLKKEINQTWEGRDKIEPTFDRPPAPQMLEILKLLPKTNCKKCGEPTCMVFALRVIDEVKEVEDCPDLEPVKKTKLTQYIGRFNRES